MDTRFLTLTASLAVLTFAGVWMAMEPGVAAPVLERATTSPAQASETVYYPGCNAVRAAGKAPLYRDQPGYRQEMDGDNDGIACEPHVGEVSEGGGKGLGVLRYLPRRVRR